MIVKNTTLRNSIRRIVSNHPEVSDIILFGSVARGKDRPHDVDVLVLFTNKVDKDIEHKIRKEIEKHEQKVSILSKTEKTIFDETFDARESILFEGISFLSGQGIAEKNGFLSFGMFKYTFNGWTNLQKTKFYYALNGRGGNQGISSKLGCIKLSDAVILAPLSGVEEFKEFLDSWKLDYIYVPMLIPIRLGRKKILE